MFPDIVIHHYQRLMGTAPEVVVRAPGRINLIGEHTDYNEGLVLPAAIDKALWLAASERTDEKIRLYAVDLSVQWEGNVESLRPVTVDWANYILGVFFALQEKGYKVGGMNLVFGGDIPQGAGLSSSAALAAGTVTALAQLYGLDIGLLERAYLAQRSEHAFAGVQCGIMDMFASLMGKSAQVVQLDCRNMTYAYFPFDTSTYALVLCDTGVKHRLADSEYNVRRAECEQAAAILGVKSLRDCTYAQVIHAKAQLPITLYKRARYVTEELYRVQQACEALTTQDMQKLGALMYATHEGLQHLYEVSCPELDFLVQHAQADKTVLGARMMGGGFGGCTLNLLPRNQVSPFVKNIQTAYAAKYGRQPACHTVSLTDGVRVL